MKKIVFLGALIVSLCLLAGCSSSKVTAEESEGVSEVSESSEQKSEEKKKTKNNKKDKNDWVESSSKDVSLKNGIIRIKVKPKHGTYNIAVSNKDDKYVPVLSTANEYTTTSISLRVNHKKYRLMASSNVKCSVSKNDKGLTINYYIDQVADVKLIMDFVQSLPNHDIDMLKCTIRVKNTGKKMSEFTVKQILDTILGEKTDVHFYSWENIPIQNEVLYRSLKDQKWFTSKNDSAAMQLLFNGGDTSAPDIFALANYSTFDTSSWEPDMISFRSFDTVLSYNNSVVGAIWPAVKLLPNESADFVYYLAFAADGASPSGDKYVYSLPSEQVQNEASESISTVEEKPEVVEVKVDNPVNGDYTPKATETVEFTVKKLSSEKYSPEYIQLLLERIAELEKNSASVNREELLRLNQELDEILEALRE